MDLQIYYSKIRECAAAIKDEFPVVVSRETPDGGKAGIHMEVAARLAAKMVVDGSAALASAEDAAIFRERKAEAKRIADQEAAAAKLQVAVVPIEELNRLKGGVRSKG